MQISTEIELDAPAAAVWDALLDFEKYPEWNPFIARVEGRATPDAELVVTLTTGDGGETTIRPRVSRVDSERELAWKSHLWFRGVLDGEHVFRLIALDERRTRLVNSEKFSGVLLSYMGRRLTQYARGFVGMNEALKRRVEGKR